MNDRLTALTELLRELPGIGPRQARRLALWLMRKNVSWVEKLSNTMLEARASVRQCDKCMRLSPSLQGGTTCAICSKPDRDHSKLLVVEKDVDLENIDRTGMYNGMYFVLGGTTSLLDKEPERHIHVRELQQKLESSTEMVELIYALSATSDGEDTTAYLEERLQTLVQQKNITVTHLGRGLSTGTELEYVDAATMKDALKSRS